MLLLLVWAVWSMGGVEVAAELSKAAQARQYQRQAIKALKAKDPQRAIRALKELEPVTNERPWEWLYVYGTLLVEYGATPAERKTGHDLLLEVADKMETMGKEEDPSYQPYYDAALDRLYEWKEKEEAAFARAEAAGTAAAYAEYLAAYPQGRHAAAAEEKQNTRAAAEKKRAEEARREEAERSRQAKRKETLSSRVKKSVSLRRRTPLVYPQIARTERWEGTVLLLVSVAPSGRPDEITIERSSGHTVLDKAAIDTVTRWTFYPAKDGDVPIYSIVKIPIKFSLSK